MSKLPTAESAGPQKYLPLSLTRLVSILSYDEEDRLHLRELQRLICDFVDSTFIILGYEGVSLKVDSLLEDDVRLNIPGVKDIELLIVADAPSVPVADKELMLTHLAKALEGKDGVLIEGNKVTDPSPVLVISVNNIRASFVVDSNPTEFTSHSKFFRGVVQVYPSFRDSFLALSYILHRSSLLSYSPTDGQLTPIIVAFITLYFYDNVLEDPEHCEFSDTFAAQYMKWFSRFPFATEVLKVRCGKVSVTRSPDVAICIVTTELPSGRPNLAADVTKGYLKASQHLVGSTSMLLESHLRDFDARVLVPPPEQMRQARRALRCLELNKARALWKKEMTSDEAAAIVSEDDPETGNGAAASCELAVSRTSLSPQAAVNTLHARSGGETSVGPRTRASPVLDAQSLKNTSLTSCHKVQQSKGGSSTETASACTPCRARLVQAIQTSDITKPNDALSTSSTLSPRDGSASKVLGYGSASGNHERSTTSSVTAHKRPLDKSNRTNISPPAKRRKDTLVGDSLTGSRPHFVLGEYSVSLKNAFEQRIRLLGGAIDHELCATTHYYLKAAEGLGGQRTIGEVEKAESLGVRIVGPDEFEKFIKSWNVVDHSPPRTPNRGKLTNSPDISRLVYATDVANSPLLLTGLPSTSSTMNSFTNAEAESNAPMRRNVPDLVVLSCAGNQSTRASPASPPDKQPDSAQSSHHLNSTSTSSIPSRISSLLGTRSARVIFVDVDDEESVELFINGGMQSEDRRLKGRDWM